MSLHSGGLVTTDCGSIINVFGGLRIDVERSPGKTRTISIDSCDVVGIEPVYLGNVEVKEQRDLRINNRISDAFAIGAWSADRKRAAITCEITGPNPFLQLSVTLANHGNSHRPTFTPTVLIPA